LPKISSSTHTWPLIAFCQVLYSCGLSKSELARQALKRQLSAN